MYSEIRIDREQQVMTNYIGMKNCWNTVLETYNRDGFLHPALVCSDMQEKIFCSVNNNDAYMHE